MASRIDYRLVCPFLTDNPEFSRGVEFGLIYARLRKRQKRFADYVTIGNQDQVLLLASRFGYRVVEMEPWGEDWFWLELEHDKKEDVCA